ncbi:MAG: hypothetical protein JWM89_1799 [Acidimicrobiales bacterium]|nr:hypothetical protein [Acidimicrobiales bacterium]
MAYLPCAVYTYVGGPVTLPTPTDPDPGPGTVPATLDDQPNEQGGRVMVRMGEFPGYRDRGVLWNARIEGPNVRAREAGGNAVTVIVPNTPQNLRIIGDRIPGAVDRSGKPLYHLKKAVSRELIVGSTVTGKARQRFVVRDPVDLSADPITIKGVGFVGGITADRVIGAPTRLNLIGDRIGSFESGDLTGWQEIGDIDAEVVPGGLDGGYKVRLRGDPVGGENYIQARARYVGGPHPWGRQAFAAQANVQLPDFGIDIEDYGLVSLAVYNVLTGLEYWPGGNADLGAGRVTGDMRRGAFTLDPVEGIGYLPPPPYTLDLFIRLRPTDEDEWTYYDNSGIIRPESSSTVHAIDVTRHVGELFHHSQEGRQKSAWGPVRVSYGTPNGTEKVGTWFHADGQSLNDALEGVCAEGVEIYDFPSGRREVRSTKRRGARRNDLVVQQWDILGKVRWQIDPGAQRTTARATSSAGALWGGADAGAIDTRQADGQVIDVVISGPVGMTPSQLQTWVEAQLATLRLIQMTTTLIVRPRLGERIAVGDSIRVALRAGSAGHIDWLRVYGITPGPDGRFIALDVGTDPDLGGH